MRRALLLTGYLIGMALLGFVVLLVAPRVMNHKTTTKATPTTVALATPTRTEAPASPTPLPASPYPAARLVIPSLNVNSGWTPLGYLSDGLTMASPAGPMDLGWYDFSDKPGGDSNTIFSGHVDWYTGAHTIFERVATLKEGDEIDVSREDGKLRKYQVVSLSKPAQDVDATSIIAPTDVPTVTLITCVGDWNPVTHEYSNRLVVVAKAPKGG
jgi:LPXTG-site transpeptidase (sortase) family protein